MYTPPPNPVLEVFRNRLQLGDGFFFFFPVVWQYELYFADCKSYDRGSTLQMSNSGNVEQRGLPASVEGRGGIPLHDSIGNGYF
jgi:hypothetical protein